MHRNCLFVGWLCPDPLATLSLDPRGIDGTPGQGRNTNIRERKGGRKGNGGKRKEEKGIKGNRKGQGSIPTLLFFKSSPGSSWLTSTDNTRYDE